VTISLTEQMICALRLSEYFDHLGIGYPLGYKLGNPLHKMTSFHPYCDCTNWTDQWKPWIIAVTYFSVAKLGMSKYHREISVISSFPRAWGQTSLHF